MQIDLTPISESRAGTTLHPVMAIATVAATVLMLVWPRKKMWIPFLFVAFLGSWGQYIYFFGVHFYIVRILIIAGLARVMSSKDPDGGPRLAGGWNPVDTVYVLWVCFHALSDIVRTGGASSSLVSQSAFIWDWLGAYLLVRAVIRSRDDIFRAIEAFAVLALVIGAAMVNEKLRSQNIFGYLGVNPIIPQIREGSIRAQAAFAHPILAGVAGATLMPLFWLLWKSGKAKKMAIVGIVGSGLMILTSASSTPVMSLGSAILGVCMWPLRKKMRMIRWGIALSLIGLHLVMKAPVWFLIARVDLIAGNSGYHRAGLIDQCIRHFGDWWLYGSSAMATWGWDMWDLSNQFVVEADCGGIFTIVCFILVISRSFGRIGKARKLVEGDTDQEWFFWLLGITLLTHAVSYFGISYQDQNKFVWCAFLAIAIVATYPVLAKASEPQTAPIPNFRSRPLQVEPAASLRKSNIVLKKT
jgi:hypothetical protein